MNLHAQDVPNAANFLPGPSYDKTSPKFLNDSAQYEWGKSVRETDLGKQALDDMSWQLSSYLSIFSDIIGIDLSDKNTPFTYELLKYGIT